MKNRVHWLVAIVPLIVYSVCMVTMPLLGVHVDSGQAGIVFGILFLNSVYWFTKA